MTNGETAQLSVNTLHKEVHATVSPAQFKAGEPVPCSGLYAELAANGFKMGEFTLKTGEKFPANQHPSFTYQLIKTILNTPGIE